MSEAFILFLKLVLIPELPAIIAAIQGRGEIVTEAAIVAEMEARGLLNVAQVDDWIATHPVDPSSPTGPTT
jgi:hypothetical protein